MGWRLVAAGAALFCAVILGIYYFAARSAARDARTVAPSVVDSVATNEPCRAGPRQIAMTRVTTGPVNARLTRGDADISSNDWTRLEVGYRFETDTAEYALRLRVTWSAREANADRSLASTLIRSERVVELFSLPVDCPQLRIADLGSLSPTDTTFEYWVEGRQHDFVRLPDLGVLSGLFVRFDGPGAGDARYQTLQADLPAFSVSVARRPE